MSYTRTSKRTATVTGTYNSLVIPNGSPAFAGPSGFRSQDYDLPDTKSGEKVDNWRKKIKLGTDVSSYYLRDSYKISQLSPCKVVFVRGIDIEYPWGSKEAVAGGGFPYAANAVAFSHEATDLSKVDGEALTLLYKKVREASSQMNGLQFFGELREALRMIRRPADSIWKGLEKYNTLLTKRKQGIRRKLPRDKKIDIWKDIVAGTWLEVSFGWKPLVSDTQDIAKTLARFTEPDTARTRARAYKEDLLGSSNAFVNDAFCGHSQLAVQVDLRTKTTGGVQYICGLRSDGSGPSGSLERLRNLSGLTLENFVPTLWELTPYSFLFDYFVNIGDILNSAFTSTVGVTWKMKTQRLVTERVIAQVPFYANLPPWVVLNMSTTNGLSQIVKSTMERIPIAGSLGIPNLVFSLPGRTNRYLNIAALLAGSHHSRFRI